MKKEQTLWANWEWTVQHATYTPLKWVAEWRLMRFYGKIQTR
jgi:hypothetical protein